MILILILLLCISPACGLLCQRCFNQQQVNLISQIIMSIVFLTCLLSPAFVVMQSAVHWEMPIFVNVHLAFSLYYDALTWVMLCLVSFISLVIHGYSARYLLADLNQKRFMGQLSLLTFSIMLLMMSGGLLTAFIAWQLIGLSLYLLLNHYHYDIRANQAAKKKFMINRVGDICFLLAVVIALLQYGSTEFIVLFTHAASINPLILILVFIAIMTKSAQFPFHIWLIDTMEAPTPVSALMHAGVINAGGFLLARFSILYDHFTYLLFFIFLIGFITAIMGNLFMQYQADVKKQLAYSTMGQMGYMLMQCGLGCFASAVFHLIAHGFFKASLFLSSGGTLKQANQIVVSHDKKLPMRYTNSFLSVLLTTILITMGVYYFSYKGGAVYLNPLLWFFIAISTIKLFKTALRQANTIRVKGLLILIISSIFFIYLIILKNFNILLNNSISEVVLAKLDWLIGGVVFIFFSLFALLKKVLPQNMKKKISYKIYLFGFYKGNIETIYRRYLINPIRHWGDKLLQMFYGLGLGLKRITLSLLGFYFAMSVVIIPLIGGNKMFPLLMTRLLVSIVLLLIILLMANRVTTLKQLVITLLLSILTFTSIAFTLGARHMQVMGSFQCINSLLIITGFSVLLLRRQKPNANQVILQNRLPWCHFYMSIFLLLLIGIPGTASFVSEFYMLYGLMQLQFFAAALFALGMLLLALVVLHTLQLHFFNPKVIRKYTTLVPLWLHILCLLIIGFNLFNGIYPMPLLKIIGG